MLVEYMADPEVDVKQRIQIAQDLLDRAGYNGKSELAIEFQTPAWLKNMESSIVDVDWSDVVPDIIDAEIVVDEPDVPRNAIAARHPFKPDPMVRDHDPIDEEALARARADHDPEQLSKNQRSERYAKFLLNRMKDTPPGLGPH